MANTKVTGALIADATITATNIADGAVTAAKLTGITTTSIAEGDKLFYTDARVGTYLTSNGYDTAANIIATITDSAPVTLDTLNELAAALGDDPNYATTTANLIGTKLPLAGGTLTGGLHINTTSLPQLLIQNVDGGTNAERIAIELNSGDIFKIRSLNDNNTTRVDNIITANILTGNVGIGTDNPQAHIHEASSIVTNMILEETSAGYAANLILKNTVDSFTISSDASPDGLYITSLNDPNSLAEGLFFLKATGNLGLGTSNPTANLHISSTGDAVLKIEADTDNAGTENDNPSIILSQDGGAISATIALNGDANNAFTGATGNSFYINSTNNQIFAVANNPVLFLESTGNVGLNMSDPQYPLDLYYREETGTDSTLIRLTNDVVSDLGQQSTFIDFRFLDSNSNETPQVRIGAEVGQNGDANTQQKEGSGAFVVYTNNAESTIGDAGASLAERFRVDYSGNVGIGTTSPSGKLHVDSGIAHNNIYFTTGSSGGTGYDVRLYLNGGANNSEMSINMGIAGNEDRDRIRTYQGNMYFRTNDSENMAILSNGNVGIGTTSPAAKLSVYDEDGGNSMLQVRNYATSATGSFTGNYMVELRSAYATGSTGGALLVHTQESSDSRPAMQVSDAGGIFTTFVNGKVGIGTSSPSEKLEVNGAVKITNTGAAHLILNGDSNNSGDTGNVDSIIDFVHDANQYGYRIHVENYGGVSEMVFSENKLYAFSERIRLHRDGGITFNGDTAAANALDDYEEGTWTATYTDGANNTYTGNYSSRDGHYTKIGNTVYASFQLIATSDIEANGLTGTSSLQISGLPYASNSQHFSGGHITNFQSNGRNMNSVRLMIARGSTKIFFRDFNNTTETSLNVNEVNGSSTLFYGYVIYRV